MSSSRSSPSRSTTGRICASVCCSMRSRNARPAGVKPSSTSPSGAQPLVGAIEVVLRPGAGAGVGAEREAPEQFGQQSDLDGVEAGVDPCGRVAVAAELAEQIAAPPDRPEWMVRVGERAHTGGERAPTDREIVGGPFEEVRDAISAIGFGSEDPLELGEGAGVACGTDRVGIGERPAVRHAGHHDRRVEHAERRRHDLPADLAEQRPATGEVGGSVRQGDAVGLTARRGEPECGVAGVALG